SLSALVLAASILPWCIFMGATFPLMMAYIREREEQARESFSYLYLANVLGAVAGALLTALALVELFGFRHTLWIAAGGNFSIAIVSTGLALTCGRRAQGSNHVPTSPVVAEDRPVSISVRNKLALWLLFSTGFISLAL